MRTRLLGVPLMISLFFAAPCLASTNLITTGGMEGGVYPSFLQEDCTDFESCASAQNAGALEIVPDESDAYEDELGYALQFTASRDDEYTPPAYSGTSAVFAASPGDTFLFRADCRAVSTDGRADLFILDSPTVTGQWSNNGGTWCDTSGWTELQVLHTVGEGADGVKIRFDNDFAGDVLLFDNFELTMPDPIEIEVVTFCSQGSNCDIKAYAPTSASCDSWGDEMVTDSDGTSLSDLPLDTTSSDESLRRTLRFDVFFPCLNLYYSDGGDVRWESVTIAGEDKMYCTVSASPPPHASTRARSPLHPLLHHR